MRGRPRLAADAERSDQSRLFFGKSSAPAAAAPFVKVFGTNGFLVFTRS